LARGLADGSITRGKALRLMGAALAGGALGSLGIREAAGDPRCAVERGGPMECGCNSVPLADAEVLLGPLKEIEFYGFAKQTFGF